GQHLFVGNAVSTNNKLPLFDVPLSRCIMRPSFSAVQASWSGITLSGVQTAVVLERQSVNHCFNDQSLAKNSNTHRFSRFTLRDGSH
ncbi:MAG: hypothetical protein WCH60_18065, partial [Burkholderiales bacterium]